MTTARAGCFVWLSLIVLAAAAPRIALAQQNQPGVGTTPLVPTAAIRKIAADGIFGTNLILNGDAEAGPGSPTAEKVETVPGWITTGNFTVIQYDGSGDAALKSDSPGPSDRGKNFFAGGPSNESSGAVQAIDVSAVAAAIDRGEVVFNLAAYLGGWQQQDDYATLASTFRDGAGNFLGKTALTAVTARDRGSQNMLLERRQNGMLPKLTRTIEFELRMTRVVGSYNDGYADSLSFRLDRLGFLQSLLPQTKIGLSSDKPSAAPGQAINVQVGLMNSLQVPIIAERDVPVDLGAKGAEVDPPRVTITKGSAFTTASIKPSRCGGVDVEASSPGLAPARGHVAQCCQGTVQLLQFDRAEKSSAADGITSMSFTVQLVDRNGTPVNDGEKVIGLDRDGVGKVVRIGSTQEEKSSKFGPDECLKTYNISSDVAGVATVTAKMGALALPAQTFIFVLPLSIPLIVVVMIGGLAGAFVRASLTWKSSRRWAAVRWVIFLSSNTLIGLCLFFAYLYGIVPLLTERAPVPAGGLAFGFLLGMVGGYLGQPAMDWIAARILPGNAK